MTNAIDTTIIDRMFNAVELVRQRLRRATAALDGARVAYAVVGGNAVGAWVASVDESAERFTKDVDILLRRPDLPSATAALEAEGFVYRHMAGLDVFLDGLSGKAGSGVHVVFAGEKVRPTEPVANPDVTDSKWMGEFHALSLSALVQIKLTAFRDKDRTHLRDLIDVGLVDATWPAKFPLELGQRLQGLLDTPNG